MSTATAILTELELADEISKYYADPLGFVLFAYPWGEPGPLQNYDGPDDNQREFLRSLGEEVKARGFNGRIPVMPILMGETSGHGTGKSAMGGWLTDWVMSTRPFSKGTVTAGTFVQLKSRTWAAIREWTRLCITGHWFEVQATGMYHKKYPEKWYVLAQTCKEENAQAFAGQHAADSTSWYLFDEASEVPDKVKETADGGLTDGEPMMFAWGQPVRNTGWFYRINFGSEKWENTRRVDGRTSKFTNKQLIEQWITQYGIDSDFVKVRVLGLPPSADELQYIDRGRIDAAKCRKMDAMPNDPLVAGFDVSGGGKAWNVIRFRRGLDGDPDGMQPIRIPGEHDPDRGKRVAICAELLADRRPGRQLAALFIDSAFGAPIAVALKNLGFQNVYEINAGTDSPDQHCLNMRAYMWMKGKEWLLLGGIRQDQELCDQLALPGYHINNSGKLVIESKKSLQDRGEASPDDADAFLMTFAMPVVNKNIPKVDTYRISGYEGGSDGQWMA